MSSTSKPDKKLMKEFEQRMTAAQDIQRGIPSSQITEVEAAQRRIGKALVAKDNALAKAVKAATKADKASSDLIEKLGPQNVAIAPLHESIKDILEQYNKCSCDCCIRDFELPFVNSAASPNFATESPVNYVAQGIVGWRVHSNPPPKMTNTGSGNGQIINGNLDLYWQTTVPHNGIFAMRPNQNRSSFAVFGSHKVRGRGWYFSGNDARVEVHAWVIVYLGTQWLDARHVVVSWDATKSENRTKSFGRWVDLPGRITFQANAGQQLGMIVRLYGETWANDEGLAEINIDLFGVPSNVLDDMDIDVLD